MTYQEILKRIEYPETCLVIDFETYFDTEYTLSKLSTIEYIQHRMFDFLGCGFQLCNDPVLHEDSDILFVPKPELKSYIRFLQDNYGHDFDAVTVVVHNSKFDITILKEKFGINSPYVIDILDLARHYDSRMKHDLASLAELFKLPAKGDTKQFKGLHYEEMSQEQSQNLGTYTRNDVELESSLFKLLLPKMSNPDIEVSFARHTLELYLTPKIRFNFQKANEIKGQMQQRLDTITTETGYTKKQLSGNKSFVKILQDILPNDELIPMKPGKNGPVPAFAKNDDGMKYLLTHKDKEIRELCRARQAIKSWPLHIKRMNRMTDQVIASGGKLRVPLHYYGAHTGRWTGGEKINLLNLGGKGRAGKGTDPLITAMRSLLRAPDGYSFGIVDSAQIEARILAWLAGQNNLVEGFKNGEDIYSVFASRLFAVDIHKPTGDESEEGQKNLTIKRGFGKDAILGCGYGMGADKFFERCRENDDLRPMFDSGEYDFNFIKKLITTYRNTYAEIPKFWKTVEGMFKWVIKYPHEVIMYGYDYKTTKDRLQKSLLTLWNDNGTVNLQLPSGRILYYRHCKIDGKGTITWHWGKLWGGSITENIVQAVCRDLLCYWLLKCEENKLPVVLHTYDELVCLVRDNDKNSLNDIIEIMCKSPEWAGGLPLAAEGELSEVYKK